MKYNVAKIHYENVMIKIWSSNMMILYSDVMFQYNDTQ